MSAPPKFKQDIAVLSILQIVIMVLFIIFGKYGEKDSLGKYPMFQDVHVMIFIGFGFLMTFLKRYGYSSVGFNFMLASMVVQWSIICLGFYDMTEDYKIPISVKSLYEADIAAATVLISMGAVLGQTSYIQLIIMGIIEIAIFSANSYLGLETFKAVDAGGSIFVHTFGAYFGLAVSFVLNKKKIGPEPDVNLEEASYNSDMFAMIGTVFLWLYWPSFNAVEVSGDDQHRAIINTYLSLAACCVTAFAMSQIMSEDHKFDMVHIQNSTLAGGVAVGSCANLMVQPYGAIIIGIIAGVLSVFGYTKLSPYIEKVTGLHDTCGVHNLHGMPGVLAGLASTLMAGLATELMYDESLYEIYPAMASPNAQATAEFNRTDPGLGRTAAHQAGFQILAVVTTIAIAIVSGLVTGFILSLKVIANPSRENQYDDFPAWNLPEHVETKRKSVDVAHYDNSAFEVNNLDKVLQLR
ncbi:ammonium transporter Rh type A [Aethina tumida]|uniref:ammonium transporter Rh type A n=1 Tax=Aethina tumida TaxID=116153 RepID=UPI0021487693|nr:ammonium transporter Rh type A [Aethina tumida]